MNRIIALTTALALLTGEASAQAVFVNWNNPGDGNWSAPANWNPQVVPDNNGTTTYNVTINSSSPLAPTTVTLDQQATVEDVVLQSGAILSIANARILTIDDSADFGRIEGGNFLLQSTASQTGLRATGGVVTIENANIILSNNGGNRIFATDNAAGWEVMADSTISGAGTLINNVGSFDNQGAILANQTTPLIINPADALPMQNSGTMTAADGSTLRIQGGTVTNSAAATISSDPGGRLELINATINNGFITNGSGNTLQSQYATFNNATINNAGTGLFDFTGDTTLVGGSFTNPTGGQIDIANSMDFFVDATTDFTNAGDININSSASQT
ncbi:MAG: hypothetical protein ACQKBV_05400, partial [Puniceicoccales bacterium]